MVFEPQTHPNPHSFFLSLSLLLENKQATIKKTTRMGQNKQERKKEPRKKYKKDI